MKWSILDPATVACLCDCGVRDYIAAAIDTDGAPHLVLARVNAIGNTDARYDPACGHVSHEQLGPLPTAWRARVLLAPLRCGRPTKATGRPCRTPVAHPGDACANHRSTTERKP